MRNPGSVYARTLMKGSLRRRSVVSGCVANTIEQDVSQCIAVHDATPHLDKDTQIANTSWSTQSCTFAFRPNEYSEMA